MKLQELQKTQLEQIEKKLQGCENESEDELQDKTDTKKKSIETDSDLSGKEDAFN